jgi:hypothetical protein
LYLQETRRARLTTAKPEYDSIIWAILVIGGAILVVFTYFFGVKKLAVQMLMTALLTLVLGLNLMVVDLFGTPYSGDVKVSSAPFERAIDNFREEMDKKQE